MLTINYHFMWEVASNFNNLKQTLKLPLAIVYNIEYYNCSLRRLCLQACQEIPYEHCYPVPFQVEKKIPKKVPYEICSGGYGHGQGGGGYGHGGGGYGHGGGGWK